MNAKHEAAKEYKRSQYAAKREANAAKYAAEATARAEAEEAARLQAIVDAEAAAHRRIATLRSDWYSFVEGGLAKFIERKLLAKTQSHNATAAEAVSEAIDLTELWIQHHPDKGNRSRANTWCRDAFDFESALGQVREVEETIVMAKKAATRAKVS